MQRSCISLLRKLRQPQDKVLTNLEFQALLLLALSDSAGLYYTFRKLKIGYNNQNESYSYDPFQEKDFGNIRQKS